jgi:hypothetical protein
MTSSGSFSTPPRIEKNNLTRSHWLSSSQTAPTQETTNRFRGEKTYRHRNSSPKVHQPRSRLSWDGPSTHVGCSSSCLRINSLPGQPT